MKRMANQLLIGIKAVRQLGWRYTWLYAVYQLQLRSGYLRWRTPVKEEWQEGLESWPLTLPVFAVPDREQLVGLLGDAVDELIAEAEEISSGQVRLFGGEPRNLDLVPSGELSHWTRHTGYQHDGVDIKFVWEPGRFGWATALARAYLLTNDQKYARVFWENTEKFIMANPPNCGPHWTSAQEVGLRLMALAFALGIFRASTESTPERMELMAKALAEHAERIPPTLGYARAQNNNHLLSEAAALYTAAALLPQHPKAGTWRRSGWRWLNAGLDRQINSDGEYAQHSTNYHRLILQVGLWVQQVAAGQGDEFPPASQHKLAAATAWLHGLLDPVSGQVPNLGSNDGAYVLPLTVCGFNDYRPVLQAAGRAFLGEQLLPPGQWDEMRAWLAPLNGSATKVGIDRPLRIEGNSSWAYLRAAHFTSRPNHADQLHLDLWWQGHNLAMDGGSYQYNADPPWRNALDLSSLHNTLTVDGCEQMFKAGQFLWLDWAQAEVVDTSRLPDGRLYWAVAQHDGYRKLGVYHRRMVSCEGDLWQVRDQVWPVDNPHQPERSYTVRLHWLLPDWRWQLKDTSLLLDSERGQVVIKVSGQEIELVPSLMRAGVVLAGEAEPSPTRGWISPTYGEKQPALSYAVSAAGRLPITLTTTWQLPA